VKLEPLGLYENQFLPNERQQVLPSRVIWDGTIDRFDVGYYEQIGAGYLFYLDFQEASLAKGVDCYIDFLDDVPSASQI
jgi:hypothetical protein